MKLVQFGAGNIGRSFIGQLFSQAGWEVVFIDVDQRIVQELNNRREYRVIIKRNDQEDEELAVRNVRAVNGNDSSLVIDEISTGDITSTSVGKGALPHIMENLAKGITLRHQQNPKRPLDIIIAENIRNGSAFFYDALSPYLPKDFPLDTYVGLVETSIAKMVPIMREEDLEEDPLWVFAEPYNTLIVDKKGFRQSIPELGTIMAVENIQAYVDRKLFIHNLGHAAAAYFGYRRNPDAEYIYQVLQDKGVYTDVCACMEESAGALHAAYPEDLPIEQLKEFIEDILVRIQNRSLGDTIFRVGRDLYRKLDKTDRLVGAMLLAKRYNLPCRNIAKAVRAGVEFRGKDEHGNLYPQDQNFVDQAYPQGVTWILHNVCHLDESVPLEKKVFDELRDS